MRCSAGMCALGGCREPVSSGQRLRRGEGRKSDDGGTEPFARRRRCPTATGRERNAHRVGPAHLYSSRAATRGDLQGDRAVKVFVFGSSLVSSYWNGAATYYRGIYKNLAALGCQVTFAEPCIYQRQEHRDPGDYSYAKSLVYNTPDDIDWLLRLACDSDVVIKHSGIGADDALLEQRVLDCRSQRTSVI